VDCVVDWVVTVLAGVARVRTFATISIGVALLATGARVACVKSGKANGMPSAGVEVLGQFNLMGE